VTEAMLMLFRAGFYPVSKSPWCCFTAPCRSESALEWHAVSEADEPHQFTR